VPGTSPDIVAVVEFIPAVVLEAHTAVGGLIIDVETI
jgi:hypothetical protein